MCRLSKKDAYKLIMSELWTKDTVRKQKIYLTKYLADALEIKKDYEEALSRTTRAAWYLGRILSPMDLEELNDEIDIIKYLQKEINKTNQLFN